MKTATDCWREDAGMAAATAQFAEFGAGAAIEDCPALEEIFLSQGRAEALVGSLVAHFCAAIAADPLGHPPFRNAFDGRGSTLLLAKSGRAQMLLQAREPGTYSYACAMFTDALRYDATLAGCGKAEILRLHGPREQVDFTSEGISLEQGVRLAFDCNTETLLTTVVERRLVTLRLAQTAEFPQAGREYCRQSGRLLHQSAGTLATSRREMMVALLGRMGRTEAAPVLADIALARGDGSLRWQALREALVLDTAQGFAALLRMARDPRDPLAGEAAALHAQLCDQYPELRLLENA